jgi:hypothetical protein
MTYRQGCSDAPMPTYCTALCNRHPPCRLNLLPWHPGVMHLLAHSAAPTPAWRPSVAGARFPPPVTALGPRAGHSHRVAESVEACHILPTGRLGSSEQPHGIPRGGVNQPTTSRDVVGTPSNTRQGMPHHRCALRVSPTGLVCNTAGQRQPHDTSSVQGGGSRAAM